MFGAMWSQKPGAFHHRFSCSASKDSISGLEFHMFGFNVSYFPCGGWSFQHNATMTYAIVTCVNWHLDVHYLYLRICLSVDAGGYDCVSYWSGIRSEYFLLLITISFVIFWRCMQSQKRMTIKRFHRVDSVLGNVEPISGNCILTWCCQCVRMAISKFQPSNPGMLGHCASSCFWVHDDVSAGWLFATMERGRTTVHGPLLSS